MSREGETPRGYHTARARPYRNNSKQLIRRYGYKVQEVADGINMSRGTLSDYVAGYRPFPRECLKKIASFIGCDVEEFKYLETASQPGARDERQPTSGGLTSDEPLLREPVKEIRHLLPGTQRASNVLVLPFTSVQIMPTELTAIDCACWFGMKQAQIITLITHWNGREMCYDELQARLNQEIYMFDAMRPQYINEEYTISRRQALVAIAALPTALLAVIQRGQRQTVVIEEFLSRCAASIAACRHLLDGNGLAMAESILPQYLPALEGMAQEPSAYQQAAAGLAAQAYQLEGILALHRNNQKAREAFVQKAVTYGRITENYNQYVAALEQLIGVFHDSERSTEALQTYQEILPSLNKVAPLLRSVVYVTQAWAYAHSGQEQEALRSLALSYETFPDHPENDPSFCHVNFGLPRLYLWEGFTFASLHQRFPARKHHQKAWEAFARISGLQLKGIVPERIRLEALNHQAEAAIALEDLHLCCACLHMGVQGAKTLGSQRRYNEAFQVYQQIPQAWRSEQGVKELADLFVK